MDAEVFCRDPEALCPGPCAAATEPDETVATIGRRPTHKMPACITHMLGACRKKRSTDAYPDFDAYPFCDTPIFVDYQDADRAAGGLGSGSYAKIMADERFLEAFIAVDNWRSRCALRTTRGRAWGGPSRARW